MISRRKWGAILRVSFGATVAGALAFFLVLFYQKEPGLSIKRNDFTGPSSLVKEVVFVSDGVLNKRWFMNWLGPLRGCRLNELDLEKIHHNLVAEDQVLSARLTRKFPDTLEIMIKEREPLLVLRMKKGKDGFTDWLVSSDGYLFEGTGYSRNRLKVIPSLKIDPSLIRKNPRTSPVLSLEGIPNVAPLLELARRDYPELYRQWSIVSYTRPFDSDPGASVTVHSKRVGEIRFSPRNYSAQLKRLQYLLSENRLARSNYISSIDLSHGRSVFASL